VNEVPMAHCVLLRQKKERKIERRKKERRKKERKKKERKILRCVYANRLLDHRYKLLIFFGRVFCSRFAISITF
jgi:hypothetical protein